MVFILFKEPRKPVIGYEFQFFLTVRKRNGKVFKNHSAVGLGLNFNLALWDVYHTLKKRKSEIITINSAKALRVAFAYNADHETIKTTLTEYPPEMPVDFEKELKKLPTTKN